MHDDASRSSAATEFRLELERLRDSFDHRVVRRSAAPSVCFLYIAGVGRCAATSWYRRGGRGPFHRDMPMLTDIRRRDRRANRSLDRSAHLLGRSWPRRRRRVGPRRGHELVARRFARWCRTASRACSPWSISMTVGHRFRGEAGRSPLDSSRSQNSTPSTSFRARGVASGPRSIGPSRIGSASRSAVTKAQSTALPPRVSAPSRFAGVGHDAVHDRIVSISVDVVSNQSAPPALAVSYRSSIGGGGRRMLGPGGGP